MKCDKCNSTAEYNIDVSVNYPGKLIPKKVGELHRCKECVDVRAKKQLRILKHANWFMKHYSYDGMIFHYTYTKE